MASNILCANTRGKPLQTVDKWLSPKSNKEEQDSVQRVLAIVGPSGIGKTCLTAEICRRHKAKLAAAHFFQRCSANLDLNDARYVVQSLAYQMCNAFPHYPSMLPPQDKIEELLSGGNLGDIFSALIHQPLFADGLNHDEDETMLVVLDAIDECDLQTRQQILQLVSGFNDTTPEWLHLVVTLRDDNQLLSQLEGVNTLEMKNTNENLTDLKRYLKEPMGRFMDRITLDGGLTQLVKKTDGTFLCAYFLKRMLDALPEGKKINMREVDGMFPKGTIGIYKEILGSLKGYLSKKISAKDVEQRYQDIVGMLAFCREPLPVSFLDTFKDIDPREVLTKLHTLTTDANGTVAFHHRHTVEWLLTEQEAGGDLVVKSGPSRQKMADSCHAWLQGVVREGTKDAAPVGLQRYALKRTVGHLLDVPKQQENVAKFLCNLRYIQEKIKLSDVSLRHLLGDYKHSHHQVFADPVKQVSMSEYMKKHPNLVEQMRTYYRFAQQRGSDLESSPEFTLHIAANYPSSDRIRENARCELDKKPWIQVLTALPETRCMRKSVRGNIVALDISPDGKTLAFVTKDDAYNLLMYLVNTATCEQKVDAVDIKSLKDRVGLCTRFLPDGSAVFAGSLTSFINIRGKVAPSGLDASSVQMKEKFSIECCDISKKFLMCGLTTFPWGGRSLHVSVFDLKSKKCAKTLEVLKFRFGGSAQFGVKCCAISDNEAMICAGVKQSNKPELKATIWSTSKWSILCNVDINNDIITRCLFVGDHSILFGGSVRSNIGTESGVPSDNIKSLLWDFKSGSSTPVPWDERELYSLFNTYKNGFAAVQWFLPRGTIGVNVWDSPKVIGPANSCYRIRGAESYLDLAAAAEHLVLVSKDEVYVYNMGDLDTEPVISSGPATAANITEEVCEGLSFMPRGDEPLVVHRKPYLDSGPRMTVSALTLKGDEMALSATLFKDEVRDISLVPSNEDRQMCFRGQGSSQEMCCASPDGSLVALNTGVVIKVKNQGTDTTYSLPSYKEVTGKTMSEESEKAILCALSPKDPLAALVYPQLPFRVHLVDLKTRQVTRKVELSHGANVDVSDVTFHPSHGFLMSHHAGADHCLAVWNQRTGAQISEARSQHISYVRVSPASDRLVLSVRTAKKDGCLVLRNCDNKFNTRLPLPGRWPSAIGDSDILFSPDGTTVIGVSYQARVSRVWNAGNGELLRDLAMTLTAPTEVVGMPTNTHVAFYDGRRLSLVDVASAEVLALLPCDECLERKVSPVGLRLSPRGNFIIATNDIGQLRVFQCHNLSGVKRKSTLQRMKSFTK